MPYSAGTIFLQVVPVFKDVQEEIGKNARKWDTALGDEMEKSGREAGKRANKALGEEIGKDSKERARKAAADYNGEFEKVFRDGLRKVNRELEPINIKVEKNELRKEFAQIRRELKELGDAEIDVDIDAKQAYAELQILEARLKGLQADSKNVRVKVDIDEGIKGLEAFRKRVEKSLPDIEIPVRVETKQADRALGAFERKFRDTAKRAARELGDNISPELRRIKAELEALSDADVGIDLDSGTAVAQLAALEAELRAVSAQDINIDVDVDAAAAEAHLASFLKLVQLVDGKDVDVAVDVDTGAAAAKLTGFAAIMALFSRNSKTAAGSGQEVANSFRAFNGVVLAAVTLLPALVPVLAAVGGGLIALLPILGAVAGGIGAVVIGFSGIGDAVSALGDQQDNAAKESFAAGKTMSAAANSVADAERALAEARRAGAEAVEDAQRQLARAHQAAAEAIADALKQQKQAQQDYAQSVRDVKDAEKDLEEARQKAKYDLLDLDNKVQQNQIDQGQAVIDVFNAQANYNAVMSDGSATNQDKDAALYALQEAELKLKELRQAQEELADQKAKADKNGVRSTDGVKNAEDALTSALEQQQNAQQVLADADKNLARTRIHNAQAIADAERNLARARADAARSAAAAQRNLTEAQQRYQDALTQTGDIGSASAQKVEQAMSKLGPAGQRFARFIFSLREKFYEFRDAVQEAFLPPVQKALEGFINRYGGRLTKFFVRMGRTSGKLFGDLAEALDGPAFQNFFAMMDKFGPKLLRQFGKTAINWLGVFANLMTIAAPYALDLSKAMLKISDAVLKWATSKEGTETIEKFLNYAVEVGPMVLDFFIQFVGALLKLMEAMAPFAGLVLKGLTALLGFIADMDPKLLGAIVTAIIGLVIAFQLGVGAIAAVGAGAALFASTLGTVIFLAGALITALVVAYFRFETVRKVVDAIFSFIEDHWKGILQIFLAFIALPVALYLKFDWFRKLVNTIFTWIVAYIQAVVIPTWKFFGEVAVAAFNFIYSAWTNVLWPVFQAIGKTVVWLAKNVFAPLFKAIWTVVKGAFTVIRTVWTNILWPILSLIGTVIWKLIENRWKPAVNGARQVWKDFATGVKTLWNKYGQDIFDYITDTALPALQTAFETVVGAIQTAWGALKKYIAEPIFTVIDLILNKGIIAGFNKIANFVGSKPMTEIDLPFTDKGDAVKKATGGVLPGYTPGRDVHKFYSATAGRLELSGGEAIMRPEFTSAMGPGWVNYMNGLARRGGARAVHQAMSENAAHYLGGYAKGGVLKNPDAPIYLDGQRIAAVFAAQMAIAERLGGKNWYLMQGGFGGKGIAASGTSHNFPGVGDIGSPNGITFDDQAWAEKVGLHGWARNIPGAVQVGSGAHVHALSRFSPGTAGSPQWRTGGDGMGGSDYGPRPAMLPNLGQLLANFDLSNVHSHGGKVAVVHNYPEYLAGIVKDAAGWARGLIDGPLKTFGDTFNSPFAQQIGDIPGKLVKKMASKALDLIPAKSAFNAAGKLIKGAVGDKGTGVKGGTDVGREVAARLGGILPYNGTMKYDDGGYLPPGLTSVVNLTGKPEPVFTADQFEGGVGGGEHFTYAPTFNKSDLTAEDVVRDMDHTRRKMRRQPSRYSGGRP